MTIVVGTNLFLYLLSFRKKVKRRGDTPASFPTSSSHYFNFFQEIELVAFERVYCRCMQRKLPTKPNKRQTELRKVRRRLRFIRNTERENRGKKSTTILGNHRTSLEI